MSTAKIKYLVSASREHTRRPTDSSLNKSSLAPASLVLLSSVDFISKEIHQQLRWENKPVPPRGKTEAMEPGKVGRMQAGRQTDRQVYHHLLFPFS